MTPLDTNYFKVDIQYIQKSQLLVVAKSPEEAIEMVKNNVNDGTEGFQIHGAVELTEDEKMWVLKNMQGLDNDDYTPVSDDTSKERIIN